MKFSLFTLRTIFVGPEGPRKLVTHDPGWAKPYLAFSLTFPPPALSLSLPRRRPCLAPRGPASRAALLTPREARPPAPPAEAPRPSLPSLPLLDRSDAPIAPGELHRTIGGGEERWPSLNSPRSGGGNKPRNPDEILRDSHAATNAFSTSFGGGAALACVGPTASASPGGYQRMRGSVSGPARAGQRRRSSARGGPSPSSDASLAVVPHFRRGICCISFLHVPRCCIICCLCVYSIPFRDWMLIWSSIG